MLYNQMICPYCNFEQTAVIDSRESDLLTTRRRRECQKCKKRFTTYEKIETLDLTIIKKDNRREPYNKEKLKVGLLKACEKRPISIEKIEQILDKIESKLRTLKSKEIPSKLIGEEVMKKLKTLDKVAYIRFASVYRDFADITDFQKEIKNLVKK